MSTEPIEHYYGDTLRGLFITAGLIMIISYPFFSSFVGVPIIISVVGFVVLAVFAGFMNPRQKWIIVLNTVIPIIAFIIFEYSAVYTYLNFSPEDGSHVAFFWVNQILALIFFIAAYLSSKTLRGLYLAEKNKIPN